MYKLYLYTYPLDVVGNVAEHPVVQTAAIDFCDLLRIVQHVGIASCKNKRNGSITTRYIPSFTRMWTSRNYTGSFKMNGTKKYSLSILFPPFIINHPAHQIAFWYLHFIKRSHKGHKITKLIQLLWFLWMSLLLELPITR